MHTLPRWLIAAAAALLLALAGGGAWYYRTQEQEVRRNTEASLASIARLKVNEIVQWRAERRGDAAVFAQSPAITEAVERWLAQPGAETTARILTEFRSLLNNYHYRDILLLDAAGQVRLSLAGQTAALPPAVVDAVALAFRTRQPVFTDLHLDAGTSSAIGEVIAPLFSRDPATDASAAPGPLAVIVMQIDAREFLYPVTQSWPTPSRSAEILFVRQEGDAVLYLNALRHRPDAAFHLRIPLTRRDVPAVMAVLGQRGVVEGVDYNGADVLAALEVVPDSPWFLIAKMDTTEAMVEWRLRAFLIVATLMLLASGLVGTLGLIWQQQSRYRALSRSAEALHEREASLRDTLELNQKLVGASPIGILAFDVDGASILINESAPRIIGATIEQMQAQNFRQIESWKQSGLLAIAERALATGEHQRAEVHLVTTFSKEIWIDCGLTRFESSGRRRLLVMFRDITARRKAEDLFKARLHMMEAASSHNVKAFLQLALDEIEARTGSTIGFYHFMDADQETLWLQAWSTNTVRNMCTAEGAGQHYPVSRAGVWCDCARTRQPIIHNDYASLPDHKGLPTGHAPVHREVVVPIMRADRIVAIIGVGNKPSAYDQTDVEIASLLGDFSWEIVERKRSAEALEQSVSLLQATLQSTADGILVVDREGKITSYNQRFADLVKVPPELLRSTDAAPVRRHVMLQMKDPEAVAARIAAIEADLTGDSSDVLELKDGQTIERYSRPQLVDGHSVGRVWSFRDITAQRQAETEQKRLLAELARSNTDLEEFAYVASHDLKAPLRAIDSLSLWLQEDLTPVLTDESAKHLRLLRQRTQRMERLLDDLLAYSRAGRVEADIHPVDVAKLIARVVESLDPPRGFSVEVVPPQPVFTTARTPLHQIFANLIGNAIKHHDRKEGTIRVTARDDGAFYEFSVEDDGPGIPAQYHERIFGMFQTLKPRDAVEGSGIGLALVKRLVVHYGGRVRVVCRGERGTAFLFTWPKQPPHH